MSSEKAKKTIEILIVEDNPSDVRLTVEALKDLKKPSNLSVVDDGKDVLAFLRKEGKYADAPTPNLILLDLNLPNKDGRDVLRDIKKDPLLKKIPVVVLSVSTAAIDILESYNLHADGYIPKSFDFERFMDMLNSIEGISQDA